MQSSTQVIMLATYRDDLPSRDIRSRAVRPAVSFRHDLTIRRPEGYVDPQGQAIQAERPEDVGKQKYLKSMLRQVRSA